MLSDSTLSYAEELTDTLLAVDALYRAESGDADGLVTGITRSVVPSSRIA